MNLNTPNHNLATTSCGASLATRTLAEVFTPSPEDIATLTTQYRKAVNGLYEAYRFGQMLMAVKSRIEAPSPRDAACGTARWQEHGGAVAAPGWNAGTGLKAWLAEHCPEINYSTARRFLTIAEKTNAALAAAPAEGASEPWGEAPCASAGVEGAAQVGQGRALSTAPSEAAVRDFLEGKSQRQVLKAPGKPTPRHVMSEEERAEKLAEVCKGFLQSLEGVERTGESDLLRLEDRREIVTRLKALARRLEQAVEG